MLTDEQLAEIEARANAATGPRLISGYKSWAGKNAVLTEEGHPVAICGEGDAAATDAAFFAAARADVPALLAEVKRLQSLAENNGRSAVAHRAGEDVLQQNIDALAAEKDVAEADARRWRDAYQSEVNARDEFFDDLLELLPGAEDTGIDAYDQIPRGIEKLRAEAREVKRLREELTATVRAKQENDERFQLAAAKQRERAERAERKLHKVAMVKVWTNEDGKKFVFADDLYAAVEGGEG